jgi:hypothetical protein
VEVTAELYWRTPLARVTAYSTLDAIPTYLHPDIPALAIS